MVPYTPAGKAAYVNHDSKDDPTGFCLHPGVPRIKQSPYLEYSCNENNNDVEHLVSTKPGK